MFFGLFGLPLILLLAGTLLAIAGKSEPDPKRERPAALYLSVATLIGVVLLFVATFLTANGLVELTDTEPTGFSFESKGIQIAPDGSQRIRPRLIGDDFGRQVNHDDDVSQVIGGLIVAAIALALLRFHDPKLQDLADNSDGPGARVYARHLYILCGVSLVTALGAAGFTLYGVYGIVAPDTSGAGEVTDGLRAFLSAAAVAAVAALVYRRAWQRSEDLAAVAAAPPETVVVVAPAPAKRAVKKAAPPTT
jgi:hypothetical protein